MPSKLRKAIEAVKDQTSISIAKVSNNHYTNLSVAVLKATTHDDIPVDERYIQEVLHLVSADQIYAAACARAIGKRIGRTRNWIVALKSLMLVFRIFQHGDPYFPREVIHAMKKGAKILNLSTFRDDSNSSPWDYTAFVRTFALYLEERLDCFLTGKLQRRYTNIDRRREEKGERRTNDFVGDMKPSVLLDKIAFWQRLLEKTIATRPTGAAMTNRLVQICLYAVVQESFNIYKDISEGLTLLVRCFFNLQYEDCVSAFQTILKATNQFAELSEFYSLCKRIGVGRDSEYPGVETLTEERIEKLREILKDRSSFPSLSRSPNNRLALQSPPNSNPTPQESYRDSESSKTSRRQFSQRASKFGSKRTSLEEDLLDATRNGTSQGISIDLEAYPDQFKQQFDREETFQMSKSISTHSLPVTNTMVDLISLEDWSGQEKETETKKNIKEEQQQQTNAPTSWEFVLAEAIQLPSTQSNPNAPHIPKVFLEQNLNTFGAFPEKEQNITFNAVPEQEHKGPQTYTPHTSKSCPEQKANTFGAFPEHIPTFNAFPEQEHEGQHTKSGEDWELVLPETATHPTQPSFDLNLLHNKHVPSDTSDAFPEQEQKGKEATSRQNWELVLFETAKQPTKQTQFSLENFSHQTTMLPTYSLDTYNNQPAELPLQHYNPFLEDLNESAIVPVVTAAGFETPFPAEQFSTAHTFQATPTSSAHSSDTGMRALSAPTFQATPKFSTQIPEHGRSTPAFQETPTFFAQNPDNGTGALSAPTSQATQNFSAHYPDHGMGALSALTFQATPTFSAHNPDNNGMGALSAPTIQATPTFSAHNLDKGTGALTATQNFSAHYPDHGMGVSALTFQATPTFSAHNPDNNGMGALSAPTIQATPTFSAHNLDKGTGALTATTFQTPTFSAQCPDNWMGDYGNDPFAAFTFSAHNPNNGSGVVRNDSSVALDGGKMFEGSRNQPNLMNEQQIWLHERNKIIAKNRA